MEKRAVKFGLRVKILSVCLLFLLLNSALVGVLCFHYVTRDTVANFVQSSNDLLSQINSHLNDEMRGISQKVAAINANSSIYQTLHRTVRNGDSAAYAALLSDMADVITEFQNSDDFVSSMYVYTPLGSFESFTHIRRQDFDFPNSILYEKFAADPTTYVAWYPAMESPVFRDTETVIPVVYKVRMDGAYGYFIVSLYQKRIQEYLDKTYYSYDYLFILDADGQPITEVPEDTDQIVAAFAQTDWQGRPAVSQEIVYEGKDYLATHTVLRSNGWQIYALRSYQSLTGGLRQFRNLITLVLIGCVLASGALVTLFVRRLTEPLIGLARLMDRTTHTRDFSVRAPYRGRDEVGMLTTSFNHLLSVINRLINQLNVNIQALQEEKENVRRIQTQKRKAEIKALQAQINPHFLYNTLNAISWQAADQGETQISVLATSLGRFFRISLNRGQEVVEVEEEMEQVRSYLRIQKIRYQDLLDYDFAVEDEVRHQKMIKLVVQPLVENAIYHGLKPLGRPGHIYIRAQLRKGGPEGPMIWITVEDDGAGIPAEKLAVLNETLAAGQADPDKGYGIFNVNERIKLYYGNTYGLMLESLPGQGTRATLNFPSWIVEEPDDEAGV